MLGSGSLLLLSLVFLYGRTEAQVSNETEFLFARECGVGDLVGYFSINDLNADMELEAARIRDGGRVNIPVTYQLCPGTFNVGAESLAPIVDGAIFACREQDECILLGGSTQVTISPETTPEYNVTEVQFSFVTFSGFTEQAIAGNAGVVVKLVNSTVREFDSTRVALVQAPMTLMLIDTSIRNGTVSSSALTVEGGQLAIENSMLKLLEITAPVSLIETVSGGTTTTNGLMVGDVNGMRSILRFQGANGVLENLDILNVRPSSFWDAIQASESSTVKIAGSSVVDASELRFGVSADSMSTIGINGLTFFNNTGAELDFQRNVKALLYNSGSGIFEANRVKIDGNENFAANYYIENGASMFLYQSCVLGGEAATVAFQSSGSSYETEFNYVDPSFQARVCPDLDEPVAVEVPGSCVSFGNFTDSCLADTPHITPAPSSMPSVGPSSPPSSSPSDAPSGVPSVAPSAGPSTVPSSVPSGAPSISMMPSLSSMPSNVPSISNMPTVSSAPSARPSVSPTDVPSAVPSDQPSSLPSVNPSDAPSMTPTISSMPTVSSAPSAPPSVSSAPSASPSAAPTFTPTRSPTPFPTSTPLASGGSGGGGGNSSSNAALIGGIVGGVGGVALLGSAYYLYARRGEGGRDNDFGGPSAGGGGGSYDDAGRGGAAPRVSTNDNRESGLGYASARRSQASQQSQGIPPQQAPPQQQQPYYRQSGPSPQQQYAQPQQQYARPQQAHAQQTPPQQYGQRVPRQQPPPQYHQQPPQYQGGYAQGPTPPWSQVQR